MSPHKLLLATRNKGKIEEFRRILEDIAAGQIELVGLDQFPGLHDVDETGSTFEENALLKAREMCEASGIPAIADDSGLCVDFLNGDPGIYSARWSGVHGDDLANIQRVLLQLDGVLDQARSAHFVCEVALVFPSTHRSADSEVIERGKLEGIITLAPRGSAGFGYDPIFQPAGQELTLGEFAHGEKDKISHRGIALRAMAPRIGVLL